MCDLATAIRKVPVEMKLHPVMLPMGPEQEVVDDYLDVVREHLRRLCQPTGMSFMVWSICRQIVEVAIYNDRS